VKESEKPDEESNGFEGLKPEAWENALNLVAKKLLTDYVIDAENPFAVENAESFEAAIKKLDDMTSLQKIIDVSKTNGVKSSGSKSARLGKLVRWAAGL
jgi:hypothetical protein